MSWWRRIAEREIERARDAGELSGHAYEGRPLPRDALSQPGDPLEQAGYRLMRKQGAVPPEVSLRAKAARQLAALQDITDPDARKSAMKDLADTQMRLAMLMERKRARR